MMDTWMCIMAYTFEMFLNLMCTQMKEMLGNVFSNKKYIVSSFLEHEH